MVLADDDPRWRWDPVEQAIAACEGGAAAVQLRCKHTPDRRVLAFARVIRETTRRAGVPFLMNDRFDLAWLCDADGVHLGQADLPPASLPEAVRQRLIVGWSTHDEAQAAAAAALPVDYVAFGPVFGTTSKDSPYGPRGVEALSSAARTVAPRPLVAIGGVDSGNIRDVATAGARFAAVISAVAAADDPTAATRALVVAFEKGRNP